MAAATAIIAAASVAVSAGTSISQSAKANRREKAAQRRLDEYRRQDLNTQTPNIGLPLIGAEMARQEAIRTQAELTGLASRGGVAGLATTGAIAGQTTESMRRISAQLEEAQVRLQHMKSEDQRRIMEMQEARENADIQGLGMEIASARGEREAAWQRGVSTLASVAQLSQDTEWGNKRLFGNKGIADAPKADGANTYGSNNSFDMKSTYDGNPIG